MSTATGPDPALKNADLFAQSLVAGPDPALKIERELVYAYLGDLRRSGVVNMYGAGLLLEEEFGFDHKTARHWLSEWMESDRSSVKP